MYQRNISLCGLILLIAIVIPQNVSAEQQLEIVRSKPTAVSYLSTGPMHEALEPSARAVRPTQTVYRLPPVEKPTIERPPQHGSDSVWVDGY